MGDNGDDDHDQVDFDDSLQEMWVVKQKGAS